MVRGRKVGGKEGVRVVGGADPYGVESGGWYVDGRWAGKRQEQTRVQIRLLRWEKVAAEG